MLSIIIPVFNEARTIHLIVEKILAVTLLNDLNKEIVFVNDCSTDGSSEVIHKLIARYPQHSMHLVEHEVNKGKGAAIRGRDCRANGEYLIIQDADLEYDPSEYNLLLQPILDGHADVVYGSRFIGGKPHRILFFWHTIANKVLTAASNALTNLNLSDMETCYKLFRSNIIKKIPLKENTFGFEPEITAKIARFPHVRIYEVGISYYGRTYAEGKKIGWKDGFRAIYCILKYNLFT